MTVFDTVILTDSGLISWSKVDGKIEITARVCIGSKCGSGSSLSGDIEEAFLKAC